jgi:ribonuclease T2
MTIMRRFVLFAFAVSALGQQCVIPGNVPSTRPTKVDYKNKDIAVDYHGLAISWSPQFCNSPAGQNPRNSWQCSENRFGFVVHGLWPQSAKARRNDEHPRNCKAPEILPATTIKPHLCTMPGAQLIQDEWVKHGTCAWPNAAAYLDQVEALYKNLVLPDLRGGMTRAGAIRKIIVDANKSKGLKPEHTQVRVVSGNRFSELMICYDKKFRFTACADPGTPDDVEVRVAAKR